MKARESWRGEFCSRASFSPSLSHTLSDTLSHTQANSFMSQFTVVLEARDWRHAAATTSPARDDDGEVGQKSNIWSSALSFCIAAAGGARQKLGDINCDVNWIMEGSFHSSFLFSSSVLTYVQHFKLRRFASTKYEKTGRKTNSNS